MKDMEKYDIIKDYFLVYTYEEYNLSKEKFHSDYWREVIPEMLDCNKKECKDYINNVSRHLDKCRRFILNHNYKYEESYALLKVVVCLVKNNTWLYHFNPYRIISTFNEKYKNENIKINNFNENVYFEVANNL